MKLLGRSSGVFFLIILLLALLQGAIVSYLSTTVAATGRFHVSTETLELHRSISRYRQLLEHDDSRPEFLKVHDTTSEQGDHTTKRQADGAVEQPDKQVDELHAVKKAEIEVAVSEAHEQSPKENENGNPTLREKTEIQRQRDLATKVEEPQNSEEQQKGLTELQSDLEEQQLERKAEVLESRIEKQDSDDEQQVAEERKTEEMAQESESKTGDHRQGQDEPKVVEERTKEMAQDSESKTEDQQQVSEDSKVGEEEKTAQEEPESKSEDQHQGEEQKVAEEEKTDDKGTHESNTEEQKVDEKEEEVPFVFPEPYLLGPTINDWDEQRGSWLQANPRMNETKDGKPRVLIVTGSQPDPCRSPVGDNFHIKSLKIKIDYARMHNYELYYNFAWLDPLFGSYWVKLPIVRKLMLTHPEIEWFFWIDSDAVFTDMLFEAPFHMYEGYNMVMWGWDYGFFTKKSWIAMNAGVFLIRNCQWSLDLIDKWSPMGPDGPVRDEYGKILTDYLSDRIENYPADDQSALAYLILTDNAVQSKVKLIDLTDYMVSGWWIQVVDTYETSIEKYHPGLGDPRWPWITHFTGCGPCGGDSNTPDYEKCIVNIDRAFNFADNQVLAYMGFQHESLSSPAVIRTRNETDRPLEFLDVNPWGERIAQVAAAAAAEGKVP